jgi:hypothetical protein
MNKRGGIFVGLGSLIAIAGLIWLVRTVAFVATATKAPGTVIEVERTTSSKGASIYHPIFTFSDASGIMHTQRTFVGSSTYTFEPGNKVAVLYIASEPTRSEIDSFQTIWIGPLICTGFGLLFGGLAYYLIFQSTRKPQPVKDINVA